MRSFSRRRRAVAATLSLLLAMFLLAVPAEAGAVKVWQHTFNGGATGGSGGVGVATDPGNGNVYVLTVNGCCLFSSIFTVAYNSAGTKLWSKESIKDDDEPKAITVDPATHDVIVTGTRAINTKIAILTIVYSATGQFLWSRYHATTGQDLEPAALAPDGHGQVIVTGTADTRGDPAYLTLAYRISDGTLDWSKRYDGSHLGQDVATAVAVDPGNGQVYVTGSSMGHNFGEMTTIAYSGATGATLWTIRDTGNDDTREFVVVDTNSHNVYTSTGVAENAVEFHTFAFTSTGTPLWDKFYANPNGMNAFPEVAAIDSGNGQVYVGGEQRLSTGEAQTVLVGYSAVGTELFVHREHSGNDDIPWAIATDPANHNIYMTATRNDSGGFQEFVTFADTAAGARVWTATHQTTVNNGSSGPSSGGIAVDPTNAQVDVVGSQSNHNGNSDAITIAYQA